MIQGESRNRRGPRRRDQQELPFNALCQRTFPGWVRVMPADENGRQYIHPTTYRSEERARVDKGEGDTIRRVRITVEEFPE